ncbi:LVIVD repeat-containing protein [Myxococcus faecalis]|uniref:LVIVD repeat-containing protein n=1 Tax=Myxococcus faecalis TaxID=3115646 RepID=UPI0038D0C9C6
MALESPAVRTIFVGLMLLGFACSDDKPRQPEPPPPPPPVDPWDGTYTPLVDPTDWEDPGEYAPCTATVARGTTFDCDSPALFDVSKCDTASLATLDPQGIYMVDLRNQDAYPDFVSVRVPRGGGAGTMDERPLTRQELTGRFHFTSRFELANAQRQVALLGCQVSRPGYVTGCYARCTNGKVGGTGTFEAARMTWGRGEAESSGGLRLLSETFVTPGQPVDVYVDGHHAYVVSVPWGSRRPGGLTVFDIRDRARPVLTKKISLPGDSYWNAAWTRGDALYVASKDTGVLVFDITERANPTFVRNVPGGPPLNVHTLFVEGDRLYAVSPGPSAHGETLLFDISRPLEPTLLNRIVVSDTTSYLPSAHDSFAYQDRLYVNHFSSGYVVFDVKDAMNPKELGAYTFASDNSTSMSHAGAVGTFGGRTIAFEGGEYQGTHLRVLDVTDPTNIPLIGRYKLRNQTSIHNMVLKDKRLYIAYYHEGLRVLDVSIPPQPKQIAHFNTFREDDPERTDNLLEGAIGIRVPGDGHVYVVDTARGLLIFNEP